MIELRAINRSFQVGEQVVHALDNINLKVQAGEYLSIMGASGSGKSTLLNILGLLDRATAGHYRLQGRDVTELTEEEQAKTRSEKIGFIFQIFHLVPRLTAEENVELPMVLAGIPPAQRKPRVQHALSAVGLQDRSQHLPDQLSGGQRQRVAIARATIMKPAMLFADEPTGNLDRHAGLEVVEILEKLNAHGITLLIVTHDPDLGNRAKRQLQMLDGHITHDSYAQV